MPVLHQAPYRNCQKPLSKLIGKSQKIKMSESLESYSKASSAFSVLIASAFEKDRESVLLMAEDMEAIDEKYARVFRWVIANYTAFSDIDADEGFNE